MDNTKATQRVENVKGLVRPALNILCGVALVMYGGMILCGYRIPSGGMETDIFKAIIGLTVALPTEYAVERGLRHLIADRKKR